jgi:hypothetical protein
MNNDDFYIGWQDKAPQSHGRAMRRLAGGLLVLALLAGAGIAASQRIIGTAFFEWGDVREFTGLLRLDPYPHLVLRDDAGQGAARVLAAPLVAPFKFGLPRAPLTALDGRQVSLRATRIYRDGALMLEALPESILGFSGGSAEIDPEITGGEPLALGTRTFRGEIVDSKCWMGVMNPGVLTPHRACAVRCISGGIPPMLLVRRVGAPPLNLLLTDASGAPVNDRVLDLVAEPVEITGEVERRGSLLVLKADPDGYRRVP